MSAAHLPYSPRALQQDARRKVRVAEVQEESPLQPALPSDWFRLVWRAGHARETELRRLAEELSELPLR